ncbi:hypothetical protein STEG23_010363 [Scotinomys teguina]
MASGCCKALDSDLVALSCSSGLDVIMALGSSAGHPDLDSLKPDPWTPTWTQVSNLSPGIHMTLNGNRSKGHQLRPQLCRTQTQIWSSAAASVWMSLQPQVSSKATQISMAPVTAQPSAPTWPQVVAQTPGFCVAFSSNIGYGH